MKAHYSAEQKQQVLEYLANGVSVKDTSDKTGVGEQTIRNWKSGHNKSNGAGAPKKKTKKAESQKSVEERMAEYALWSHLEQLQTGALRRMLNEPDKKNWPLIEIEYLRERCKAWGDDSVGPLLEAPGKEASEQTFHNSNSQ